MQRDEKKVDMSTQSLIYGAQTEVRPNGLGIPFSNRSLPFVCIISGLVLSQPFLGSEAAVYF